MFENELMTPDDSQARADVRGFLIAYLWWASNDAPQTYFKSNTGLCGNLIKHLVAVYGFDPDRTQEAGRLFSSFLKRDFGEGRWYPFGADEYFDDQKTRGHHRRPERIAWVIKIIAELSPCEQQ